MVRCPQQCGRQDEERVDETYRGPVGRSDLAYERFARLAQAYVGSAVSLVSFVDDQGQVFPGALGLPEPWAGRRGTGLAHSFCQHVVRSGEPLVVTDAREVDFLQDNLAIPDLGAVAYAGFPLVDAAGRAVGSLCAIDHEPRTWTAAELEALQDLAAACSSEVQLRSQGARSTDARDQALRRDLHSRSLLVLSEAFAATRTVEDVLDEAERTAGLLVRAERVAIGLVAEEHLVWARHPDLADADDTIWRPIPLTAGTGPTEAVIADGKVRYFGDGDAFADEFPAMRGVRGGAVALLPLVTATATLGVVTLRWSTPRHVDEDDRSLLTALATYAALALERAQLLQSRREVAHVLQAAMLTQLPAVDGLHLDAAYAPASAGEDVGGDWYDAFPVDHDGSLAVVIGDVTGHDMDAATRMGQLRSMLRALAWESEVPPSAVLRRMDAANLGTALAATGSVVLAVLLPPDADGTRDLVWSNAGHLTPAVQRADGTAELLDGRSDLIIGFTEAVRRDHRVTLAPGDTLVLYTDGLVERRGTPVPVGVERLLADLRTHAAPTSAGLVERLAPEGERADDVAVLVVRVG
jgi:serine phosphatase RsbU (regulator of sigma subunit)